jgi:hypothetical protein
LLHKINKSKEGCEAGEPAPVVAASLKGAVRGQVKDGQVILPFDVN